MTDSLAAELEALAEKATPAPWRTFVREDLEDPVCALQGKWGGGWTPIGSIEPGENDDGDAQLIVLLRNNAALLCAALRLAGAVEKFDARCTADSWEDILGAGELRAPLAAFRSLTEAPRRGA